MNNRSEKFPIEQAKTAEIKNKIGVENERIRQLLESEQQTNPEYRECLEKLKYEFNRRVAKANMLIQELSEKMGQLDWFIVPPIMSRTDYGYTTDIDLVIVHDSDAQPPEYKNEVDGVFMTPRFINKEKLTNLGSRFPEIAEWYTKKLNEEKPKGKTENQPIDVLSLEDKLRYSITPEKREQIRNYRLLLASHFMEAVKERISVISWSISGSTVADIDRFSVCSDLDLEILVDPKTPEQESEIFFYLHNYLKYKFAEDYETKICFTETTLDFIKRISDLDPKMRDFFERQFRIKLE